MGYGGLRGAVGFSLVLMIRSDVILLLAQTYDRATILKVS